jgi:hypothetical protein
MTTTEADAGTSRDTDKAERRGRPAARRSARRAEEPTPVLGGRLLTAAVFIAVLAIVPAIDRLSNALEPKGPPPPNVANWQPGKTEKVSLTLVTADYNRLACAAPGEFGDKHCAYKSETEVWPRDPNLPLDDNKANVVQPYRTWIDNRLILASGVWATPELAMRLHREPPTGMEPDKLARFVAECEMTFLGHLERPKLRWAPGQAWNADPDVPKVAVAHAKSCRVVTEPDDDCPQGLICKLMRLF